MLKTLFSCVSIMVALACAQQAVAKDCNLGIGFQNNSKENIVLAVKGITPSEKIIRLYEGTFSALHFDARDSLVANSLEVFLVEKNKKAFNQTETRTFIAKIDINKNNELCSLIVNQTKLLNGKQIQVTKDKPFDQDNDAILLAVK